MVAPIVVPLLVFSASSAEQMCVCVCLGAHRALCMGCAKRRLFLDPFSSTLQRFCCCLAKYGDTFSQCHQKAQLLLCAVRALCRNVPYGWVGGCVGVGKLVSECPCVTGDADFCVLPTCAELSVSCNVITKCMQLVVCTAICCGKLHTVTLNVCCCPLVYFVVKHGRASREAT